MPAPITPAFAKASKSAKILDMTTREFLELVDQGALPSPVRFGRWDVDQLKKVMRGDMAVQEGAEM